MMRNLHWEQQAWVEFKTLIKSPWKSEPPEVKIGDRTYTLVNPGANSSTDNLQSCIGPFLCKVDQCQQQWKSSKGWQKEVLSHFHSAHERALCRPLLAWQPLALLLCCTNILAPWGKESHVKKEWWMGSYSPHWQWALTVWLTTFAVCQAVCRLWYRPNKRQKTKGNSPENRLLDRYFKCKTIQNIWNPKY